MNTTTASPLTLKSNFDPSKVRTKAIKCLTGENAGYSHKVDFSYFEGREDEPIEEMLNFCRDFIDGMSQFTFETNDQAIRAHHEIFNSLLQGDAKNRWRICLSEANIIPSQRNLTTFWNAVADFKNSYLPANAASNLHNYLDQIKKPREMKVTTFVNRYKILQELYQQLPTVLPSNYFTDEQVKLRVFYAMPSSWQDKFNTSDLRIESKSLNDLKHYFSKLEATEHTHMRPEERYKEKKRHYESQSHQNKHEIRHYSPQRKFKYHCKVHGYNDTHEWAECRQNPKSKNYIPLSKKKRFFRKLSEREEHKKGEAHYATTHHEREKEKDKKYQYDHSSQKSSQNESESEYSRESMRSDHTRDSRESTQYSYQSGNSKHSSKFDYHYLLAATNESKEKYHSENEKVPELLTRLRINGHDKLIFMRTLADSGSSATLIADSSLPCQVPLQKEKRILFSTVNGIKECISSCQLYDVCFPELAPHRKFKCIKAYIFHDPKPAYNIILGRDIMDPAEFIINFETKEIQWHEFSVSFKKRHYWNNVDKVHMYMDYIKQPSTVKALDAIEALTVEKIVSAKYEPTAVEDIANHSTNLNPEQKKKLSEFLSEFKDLFQGKLGCFRAKKVHIQLKEGHKPYHGKPFPVPHIHKDVVKNELNKLCKLNVLEPCGESAWGCPTFIVPKKDGSARFVTDFRKLNQAILRKPYPLPNIAQIVQRREGFTYLTKLDMNMGYYHFVLDEESSALCVIVTPWGKFRYKRLPQGCCISSDIFQATMAQLFAHINEVEVFIDDIGIFTKGSFEDHLKIVGKVLQILSNNGFQVNAKKSSFAVDHGEYLGFIMTQQGVKPDPKKVSAILGLKPAKDLKQLRGIIGLANYYRDMWPNRAHIMKPLTDASGKKHTINGKNKFVWTNDMQKALDELKAIVSQEVLLQYPDYTKPFDIFVDASEYQMGAVIKQNGKPLAFWSKKLNKAQTKYTTGERELLSIVEVLKEYRNMLLGYPITIYSDHKNLVHETEINTMTSSRMIRWRLLIEEFGPTIKYIKGEENIEADQLSRLDIEDSVEWNEYTFLYQKLFDIFMFHPAHIKGKEFPVNLSLIARSQRNDEMIKQMKQKHPGNFRERPIGLNNILEYRSPVIRDYRIILPHDLQQKIIEWYHQILNHPGSTKLYATLSKYFYFSGMKEYINEYTKSCDTCQRYKLPQKAYGELPEKLYIDLHPWEEISVDLIGPWTVNLHGQQMQFHALTTVDHATGIAEINRIKNKSSSHIAMTFINNYLARYPRPLRCIFDNGGEFVGQEFQQALVMYGIEPHPTTVKNPQANAICERLHQVIATNIRTYLSTYPPEEINEITDVIDTCLASASYSTRAAIHIIKNYSPAQLAFNRDMILPITFQVDWQQVHRRTKSTILDNLQHANAKRISIDYKIGDEVLLLHDPNDPSTLKRKNLGPFPIVRVHANGTLTIERHNFLERLNIRRLRPYFRSGGE